MNKKVISIIAIVAIIAILGVVLVACNADSYQKKLEKAGYEVIVLEGDEAKEEAESEGDIEWVVTASKGLTEYVTIVKFANTDDAKEAEENAITGSAFGVTVVCERSGKIVFYGTEEAVKDAK